MNISIFCFAEEQQNCQRSDIERQVNIIILILNTVEPKYLHVAISHQPTHFTFTLFVNTTLPTIYKSVILNV